MRFLLTILLLCASQAHAGDKVLNGGNLVVCRDTAGSVRSTQMLDFYEVEQRGQHVKLDSSKKTWDEKLKAKFADWQTVAPERMALYRGWLDTFMNEAGIYPGISIPAIPDYGSVAIPAACSLEPVAFQRRDDDIYPGVKRYVINKDLWDLLDETQRAGLVLHELIYREAIPLLHQTSYPTRYFAGFLASSSLVPEDYLAVVARMPLSFIEYRGLRILGTVKDCGMGSCIGFKAKTEFYDSGRPKTIYAQRAYGTSFALLNLRSEGLKPPQETQTDQNLYKIGLLEDGRVSILDRRVGDRTWQCDQMNLDIPSLNRRTDYHLFYSGSCGTNFVTLELQENSNKPRLEVPLGVKAFPFLMHYEAENAFLDLGFDLVEGQCYGGFYVYDQIDFGLMYDCGSAYTPGKFPTNPKTSWIKLPGIGVVSGVTTVNFQKKTGEWIGIKSTSGTFTKTDGVWKKK